jgi:sugar lactone lactonase YvrE
MRELDLWKKRLAGLVFTALLVVMNACGEPATQQTSVLPTVVNPTAEGTPQVALTTPVAAAALTGATTETPGQKDNTQAVTGAVTPSLPATTISASAATSPIVQAASSPQAQPGLTPTGTPSSPIPATAGVGNNSLITLWRTGEGKDRLRYLLSVATDSVGNLYLANSSPNLVRKYNPAGQLLFQIPQDLTGLLATDRQANLYVLDGEMLYKFDPDGKPLFNFRVERPGSGPFSDLSGLAIDEQGIIYVLDAGGRVYKFDRTGHYLTAWGNPSDGNSNPNFTNPKPGGLSYPIGLAADGQGHIYVGDFSSDNSQVKKYDLDGHFLLAFGTPGKGKGQFGKYNSGGGLTTDKAGNVYVVDWENLRIEKFDGQGHYLKTITGSTGPNGIQLKQSIAVSLDSQGNLYIADNLNEQVQKIAPDGTLLAKFGRQDQGEGELDYPSGIGVDSQGNVYVADETTRLIQKFDRDGHFITMWPVETKASIQVFKDDTTLQIGVDGAGNSYVADHLDNLVKKYDSTGKFLLEWGGPGSKEGQFNGPYNPFVDRQGNVFLADSGNSRIQKFDSMGNFISQLTFPPELATDNSGSSVPASPSAVAVDTAGNLYITFFSCSCLKKYDKDGHFLIEWGRPPSGQFGNYGVLTIPDGLATDNSGNIYVMEWGNMHCTNCGLLKYDSSGNLLRAWSSLFSPTPLNPPPVPQDGQFAPISAMTVDVNGNIYVGEPGYLRIQKLQQLHP